MKRILFLVFIIFLTSCQTLPQTLPSINSPVSSTDQKAFACPYPFLKEKYRLVHAVETRMAGDTRGTIIGVTLADPLTRSVSCAIMTAEGMTLFEAESSPGALKVNRALPPFDSVDFAKNMIDDIKLIFFAPEGKLQIKGNLPDGADVCRYREGNGGWIDVSVNKSEGMEIKRYSSTGILKRQIRFIKSAGNIYQRIELQANEQFNYSLFMTLIEAQPVKNKLPQTKSLRNTQK